MLEALNTGKSTPTLRSSMEVWLVFMKSRVGSVQFSVFSKRRQRDCREKAQETQGVLKVRAGVRRGGETGMLSVG
jgi:hypothetical protein